MRAGEVFVLLLFCSFEPFGTCYLLLVCLGLPSRLPFLFNIFSSVFTHQKNYMVLVVDALGFEAIA